ncbi:MAG TPA: hypothetical protein PLR74_17605, partial [Agriterribacter sp.]|nr:hypothetical protein [Agriterribacter sp.]
GRHQSIAGSVKYAGDIVFPAWPDYPPGSYFTRSVQAVKTPAGRGGLQLFLKGDVLILIPLATTGAGL